MKRLATQSLEGSLLSDCLLYLCMGKSIRPFSLDPKNNIGKNNFPFDVGSIQCYKNISLKKLTVLTIFIYFFSTESQKLYNVILGVLFEVVL